MPNLWSDKRISEEDGQSREITLLNDLPDGLLDRIRQEILASEVDLVVFQELSQCELRAV